MRISLRTRLTISFVTIILALGSIAAAAGIHFIDSGIITQAQDKVRLDLNTAREVYKNRLESIKTILEFTAIRPTIKEALVRRDRPYLQSKLDEVRREGGIEAITVTDQQGRVVLRSHNPSVHGDDVSGEPLIREAMAKKTPQSATEIIPSEELQKDGSAFAARAHIEYVPTRKAEPRPEAEERDGMMMMAASPILDDRGGLIGVISGGDLLNRDYEIVDRIKDIVYRDEQYQGKDTGTATIFQGDLRISTNVMTEDGQRAIGTRVWEDVGDQVLRMGTPWIGEAFVVNDWYFTAYEPIRDLRGQVIGMLYVGMLKRPFADARTRIIAIFSGIVLVGVVIVILAANYLAARISKPMREMQRVAQEIAGGDYSRRIAIHSNDETGELASSFNRMTEKLTSALEELRRWAETLEEKVEERTARIREMQRQLVQAEKMASVGKLAAGVAHEINNPLTGILTNASLLLEEVPAGDQRHGDLKAIVDETIRCREIVKGLLDFARQTEPKRAAADVNGLIASVIALVQNQAAFQDIRIREELSAGMPRILLDADQIRQVFMNIVLNAADAMPRGGELTIRSDLDEAGASVRIRFSDTGHGIGAEHLDRIFDPFFSTKEKGTGLGLSISYGIVERHEGTIEVESRVGHGSTFTVTIPIAPPSAPAGGEEP